VSNRNKILVLIKFPRHEYDIPLSVPEAAKAAAQPLIAFGILDRHVPDFSLPVSPCGVACAR